MRFWDSSALVPLVVEEPASPSCRRLLRGDPAVMVWTLTRTEIVSAVRRKERVGDLGLVDVRRALRRIDALSERWVELDAVIEVRDRADRLLAVHPLSAADALQLGAALILAGARVRGFSFVTCDSVLAKAAEAEGFAAVLPT